MDNFFVKNFKGADETRDLPKTKIEVINFEEVTIMRVTLEPGWTWSECVKPIANTDTCQVPHINYIISGRIKIRMNDGVESELSAGDIAVISPGHESWVVGDEPCMFLDMAGGQAYGKA